ncbi:hypothetical protein ACHAW5_000793 [Stephanodiscus triporus]|uniref:Uncharacterized protein n=1 Tax=Stephanodiscus triporus TaxID=2934178 RepID=A0ABD3MM68_9STRA
MRVHSATVSLAAASLFRPSSAFAPPPSRPSPGGGWIVVAIASSVDGDVDDAVRRRIRRPVLPPPPPQRRGAILLRSSASSSSAEISPRPSKEGRKGSKKKKKKLGLVTFDLDDTLYPIAPVLDEANAAFSAAMSNFGYIDIRPDDIVETGKGIRATLAASDDDDDVDGGGGGGGASSSSVVVLDPLRPRTVNHKEIRMAAIRKEMEGFILKTKLRQTAADWATEVDSITSPVRKSAEKWARTTVHSSVVQAVYNAWEMERHHAAERHLFPEAISTIKQIQSEHPDVVVGAVTDGSANPMLMVFSLMPLFDFTVSWEDDIGNVKKLAQFRELSAVDESDELGWIYRLAVEKGREMSALADEIKRRGGAAAGEGPDDDAAAAANDDDGIEWVWVHVGDDLAYDVGGAATTGAKTVLVELAPEYGQTARLRMEGKRPAWSTETDEQMAKHRKMSLNALDKVDARITHLSQLPEAINELLKGGDDDE